MRERLAEAPEESDRRAKLAIEIFCYRARKYIGAYLAAMNGADAIVFAGGIGENSPEVRSHICNGLEWIGIELDEEENRKHTGGREGLISKEESQPVIHLIPK